MHQCYLSNEQIDDLSIPEIAMLLDDDFETPRAPPGGVPLADGAALQEYARRWRTMTLQDRLRTARQEH